MASGNLAWVFRFHFFVCVTGLQLLFLYLCFITTRVCEFEQPISGWVVRIAAAIVMKNRSFWMK